MQQISSPRAKILVVEDEPVTGMFIRETLETAGFRVALAATAGEARQRLRAERFEFDAAILDIGLPDEPGDLLAREIRGEQPELPIIMATALSETEVACQVPHDSKLSSIGKPYDGGALIAALEAFGVRAAACTRRT